MSDNKHPSFTRLLYLISALFLVSITQAHAEQLTLSITAQKEVITLNEDGSKKIEYIAADSVIPGDILLYTISYQNHANDDAESVVISNPIPDHMTYVGSSAQGKNCDITFSIDGGSHYDSAENLLVTLPDDATRPAVPSDYTHIRWSLQQNIPANSDGAVSYRARLD